MTVEDIASQELERLTPREREYLVLAAKGLDQSECAEIMGIGRQTIHDYAHKVRLKLRMTTIEAAVLACKAGWL